MDQYNKILSGIRQWSRLLDSLAEGHTPESVKEACRAVLQAVLEDTSAVDGLPRDHLIAEAINVQRILNDPWSADQFWYCLTLHRRAYALDRQASLDECARWETQISRGLGHYWSALQLEQRKGGLAVEEFAAEAFRNIGSLLEATTQPLLRELLGQLRLTRNVERENLDQLDFGVVVSELASTSGAADLFVPRPWGVSLSQWRNVAQHHNFEVERDIIKVRCGKGLKARGLELSQEDLWVLLRLVFRIQLLVKTARSIFVVDHQVELRGRMNSASEPPGALVFSFASIAASQGFEVVGIEVQPERARAVLRDVTGMNPCERQFHASQFVQNLWAATGAMECELEYQQRDGTPTLVTLASAADCEALGNELIDMKEFARRVSFKPLVRCELPVETEERPPAV